VVVLGRPELGAGDDLGRHGTVEWASSWTKIAERYWVPTSGP
jgi:hypothetical protein